MGRMAKRLRELLAADDVLVYPGIYDSFSAQVAQSLGFPMIGIGGNSLGSRLHVAEPLLGLEEIVRQARLITSSVELPLKVDAGAGFGEPLHVMRTVRELEAAGVAMIHLEDQIFPKRAHYHKGIEHVIPAEAMVAKIRAAVTARKNPDFVIVARTDAMLTHDFDEGVRRANMFLQAGADMALVYPNDPAEIARAPKAVKGPLVYGVSDGNRKGRPIYSVSQLSAMGYKVVTFPTTILMTVTHNVKSMFRNLQNTGLPAFDQQTLDLGRGYFGETPKS